MAFIEWKDTYSVGVMEIDTQHRRLLDIINELHTAMKAGAAFDKISDVVENLASYTHYHFAYEERLLESVGYPGLADHKRVHTAMAAEVERFRKEAASKKASIPLSLMSFLKTWLLQHILETDMRYRPHVTKSARA